MSGEGKGKEGVGGGYLSIYQAIETFTGGEIGWSESDSINLAKLIRDKSEFAEVQSENTALKAEVEGLKSQLTNEKYILDQLNNSRQKLKEAEWKLGKAVEFIKQLDRLETKQDTDSFLEEIGG